MITVMEGGNTLCVLGGVASRCKIQELYPDGVIGTKTLTYGVLTNADDYDTLEQYGFAAQLRLSEVPDALPRIAEHGIAAFHGMRQFVVPYSDRSGMLARVTARGLQASVSDIDGVDVLRITDGPIAVLLPEVQGQANSIEWPGRSEPTVERVMKAGFHAHIRADIRLIRLAPGERGEFEVRSHFASSQPVRLIRAGS